MGLSEIFFVSLLTILGTTRLHHVSSVAALALIVAVAPACSEEATVSGPGKLSFAAPRTFPNRAGVILVEDLDSDGNLDLVTDGGPPSGLGSSRQLRLSVQLGDGTGSFEAPKPYLAGWVFPRTSPSAISIVTERRI